VQRAHDEKQINSTSSNNDNNDKSTTFTVTNVQGENDSISTEHDAQNFEVYNWNDISTWSKVLTQTMKYEIVKFGPIQIKNYNFPPNEEHPRRFTVNYYYRKLPSNEVVDRQ